MPEPENSSNSTKRVAILVDTSTTWGREVIAGVHRYSREHVGWQLFVEPRGLEQRQRLPNAWKRDGVIDYIQGRSFKFVIMFDRYHVHKPLHSPPKILRYPGPAPARVQLGPMAP